jgi:lipoprotein-anchoring transpeptidase ErfK/SrfK
MTRRRNAAVLAIAAIAAWPTPGNAIAAGSPALEGGAGERISNERTLTRWAHADVRAAIRSRPSRRSRRKGRLRLMTEDGQPEVYLVLRRYRGSSGTWLQIRIPGRPNGRTGWVGAASLSALHTTRRLLIVDRGTLRATVYDRGRRIFRAPVGVGKASTPTPAGHFWLRERLNGYAGSIYGPLAFGTAAYSHLTEWPGGGVVGIHGTNQPGLVPGRPSHGCIRMHNSDITRLARLVGPGTPLRIV